MSIPVQHDEQDTAAGWEAKKSGLREAIIFQFSILERPDIVLILLYISVESTQIKVRRRPRVIEVLVIRLEQVVDDQRGPVEEDTGDLIGMGLELLPCHDTVKDESRIGLGSHVERIRVHRSRVGGIGCPEMRVEDVLWMLALPVLIFQLLGAYIVAAVCLAILEFGPKIAHRWMLQRIP